MLKGLDFVTGITRPNAAAKNVDPLGSAKKKVRSNWVKQMAASNVVDKGNTPTTSDGKTMRLNFFRVGDMWYINLRLGNSRILGDGKSDTIAAGPKKGDVARTFGHLIKALDKGELDGPIQKTLAEIQARPRGKRASKT